MAALNNYHYEKNNQMLQTKFDHEMQRMYSYLSPFDYNKSEMNGNSMTYKKENDVDYNIIREYAIPPHLKYKNN